MIALRFDGLDIGEIAEHLGLREATTRSHLRHARERLKKEWHPLLDGAVRDAVGGHQVSPPARRG